MSELVVDPSEALSVSADAEKFIATFMPKISTAWAIFDSQYPDENDLVTIFEESTLGLWIGPRKEFLEYLAPKFPFIGDDYTEPAWKKYAARPGQFMWLLLLRNTLPSAYAVRFRVVRCDSNARAELLS